MNRKSYPRLSCAVLIGAVAAFVAFSAPAQAADKSWGDALGGTFTDPSNWQGGSAAGMNDIAHFGMSTIFLMGYDVNFTASVSNLALRVEDDSVGFLLNGRTYFTRSDSENHIGDVAGRSGQLFITNGTVDLTTVQTLIGATAGSSGTLTVSSGGQLFSASSTFIRVGHLGSGTLTVENGGLVQGGAILLVAQNADTTGTVNVTNHFSALDSSELVVGNQGTAALNISDGGTVLSATATIGSRSGSTGTVTNNDGNHVVSGMLTLGSIAGAGGTYNINGGALSADVESIGNHGTGTFTQFGGSNQASTQLDIGVAAGGTGTYFLDNALLFVDGPLGVGMGGNGTLTQMGGHVVVGSNLRIAAFAGSVGHFSLDGEGVVEAALCNVGVSNILTGGKGRLDILSGFMSIAGRLRVWNSTDTIVNFSGGVLSVGELDTSGNPAQLNWTAGTLHVGTSTGDLTNRGGTLAPGLISSPGICNIDGTYTQQAGGTLEIEIGGTAPGTEFDRVDVSGAASLDGSLEISLVNAFDPQLGQSFVIMNCAARNGTFVNLSGLAAGPGQVFQVQYNPTNVTLSVVPLVRGDMNGDGELTAADAGALALALTNPPAYHQQFPAGNIFAGDLNDDQLLDGRDVSPFVACLLNGGCP